MILPATDSVSVKARGRTWKLCPPSLGKFSLLLTEVNIFLEVDEDVDMWLGDGF